MTPIKMHFPAVLSAVATLLVLPALACSSNADGSTPSGGKSSSTAGSGNSSGGDGVMSGGSPGVSGSGTSGGKTTTGGSPTMTGGSGGSGTSSGCGPQPDECTSAAALMTMPISDFETGKGWYFFANVDDKGGTTKPAAGDNIMADEIMCPAGGRCGSSFAQHVTGGGFTSYGPSLSQDFLYKDGKTMMVVGMPMDASTFTGVMFWARKGDTAGAAPTLRLIVNDVTTHELGDVCDPKAAPGVGGEMSEACWDGWMTERALPSTWTLVKVPFTVMKQGGFGKKGAAIQTDKLYGLSFQMPNMATFDFWIDDVSFYEE
jgi:hypothetical protein